MDGFLLINKPKGLTSFDVCNRLRKILNTKKIGHSGTLDPLATGLLVIGVGKATKLLGYLENQTKVYEAGVLFGIDTDTYDILGKINAKKDDFELNNTLIDFALSELKKTDSQLPPIYSAIKVNGQKLYDYALKKEEVVITKRKVKIDQLERLNDYNNKRILLKIKANKGFYVRSLIHDLGLFLGSYATMESLKRTNAGSFSLANALELKDITSDTTLISIDKVFANLPSLVVNDFTAGLVKNGVILDERQFKENLMFKIYDKEHKLIAIYEPVGNLKFKPVVILR